jgi:hypothetical protein
MREGFLAALTFLLAGHELASAQQYGSYPAANSWGPNLIEPAPTSREATGDVEDHTGTFHVWGVGEGLLWWFKNGRVPPLVTTGGNGKLGSPGTEILVDNLNFDDDVRTGGRFALAYRSQSIPWLGVEGDYFFLSTRQSDISFSSGGDPLLARPFVNLATGLPDSTLVSKPGVAPGSVTVAARTGLWGAEANLAASLICSDRFHLTVLGGFRFLRLEDEFKIGEHFRFFGSTVDLQDAFRTVNCFYGGQVGLETGVQLGSLSIDFRGKVGLGQMQQSATVDGATNVLRPDGSTILFPGGLFALRSNIGRYRRDELAFVPEVGLNVGWQLTPQVKLSAGYSFLWVSTVARAGEQIDPVVNISQFPILNGNGPLVGPARPAFGFSGSDFWAQGLNLGLELRY